MLNRLAAVITIVGQLLYLQRQLKKNTALEEIYFQGKSLNYYVTAGGVFKSLLCAFRLELDPVALSHGIKRLRFPWSRSEVIWRHDGVVSEIVKKDETTKALESAYPEIKREILEVVASRKKFPDSDAYTNSGGHWSYLNFYKPNGEPNGLLHQKCPTTSYLLNKLPINLQFGFCMVSVLEPNTYIVPHRGSSTLRQRYHLCLESLEPELSKIRVGQQWITWKPGKAFGFNDSVEHEVKHEANSVRVVLVVDTWPSTMNQKTIESIMGNTKILNFGVVNRINQPVNISD